MPTSFEKMNRLSGDEYLLLNVFMDDVTQVNTTTIKSLQDQGYEGVYVALSKDYLTVSTALEQAGIDLGRLHFVDATSRMYGIAPVESAEVIYVDGPLSIDALIEGVANSVRDIKDEKRFVLLDSLTTLLLYNSPEATLAFNRSLKDLLRKEHAAGIIVLAYRDSHDQQLLNQLAKDGAEVILSETGT